MSKPESKTPATIVLFRHAEKPVSASDPNLSQAGVLRAGKLVDYIQKTFGKPDVIIAAASSKNSNRPIQTVEPLATACGLTIDDSFSSKQYAKLAKQLLKGNYAGKLVVVCWHHGQIPQLANALGAQSGDYPARWNPSVFNLVLQFVYGDNPPPVVHQITEPF